MPRAYISGVNSVTNVQYTWTTFYFTKASNWQQKWYPSDSCFFVLKAVLACRISAKRLRLLCSTFLGPKVDSKPRWGTPHRKHQKVNLSHFCPWKQILSLWHLLNQNDRFDPTQARLKPYLWDLYMFFDILAKIAISYFLYVCSKQLL